VKGLTYTLLGDGSSDRLLDYPIRWALTSLGVSVELGQWADLRYASPRPTTLPDRARAALELYPAELLLVHRDAERIPLGTRLREVESAVRTVAKQHVAVVPVRMTEAWFLHDEAAIRRASGNPNGMVALSLPTPASVEHDVDPKSTLQNALVRAAELNAERSKKKKAEFPQMRARTAELIADFAPLKGTPAFQSFLSALESALRTLGHLGEQA
jgi:hypothetical protein